MKTILFAFPGNENLAQQLAAKTDITAGEIELRRFPEGESYVRIHSDVSGSRAVVLWTLDRPDEKPLPLYFACKTPRELGAVRVELVVPYLAYMRQDMWFNPGEAVTSVAFGALLSGFADRLVTVDPHLHRHASMKEIYSVPTCVVQAYEAIAQWIKNNVQNPLLIGPDEESGQWVAAVAKTAGAPYEVLVKKRKGDKEVEVSIPRVENYREHNPVLVDDIISTARTMIETVTHLRNLNMRPAICIGVHAVFAGNAFEELKAAGVGMVITCNTIQHSSNAIDLSHQLSVAL
jgi:ribose-phosphate pyrophosphokinase